MDGIGFENFRVFKDKVLFDFAPITVLTGTNSSGKSTVIKSLKLMQDFWSQEGHIFHLNFENGTHFLGDFEMCLSKKSKNKESFKICYKIEHILFKELFVEMEFQLDNDNKLKNGIFKRAVVKTNDNITVFTVGLEKGGKFYSPIEGWNYDHIIKFIPEMGSLKSEYEKYKELAEGSTPFEEVISLEKAFDENFKQIPLEDLCEKENINYSRFKDLDHLFKYDMNKDDPFDIFMTKSQTYDNYKNIYLFESFNSSKALYDLPILDLFSEMDISDFVLFSDNLWKLAIKKCPSILNKYSYQSFKNMIEEKNIGVLWVNDILLSGEKTFKAYYKKAEKSAIKYCSKFSFKDRLCLEDFNIYGQKLFFDSLLGYTTESYTLFANLVEVLNNKKEPLTEEERQVITVHRIIDTAILLEEEFTEEKPVFPIHKIIGVLKRLLLNITFRTIRENAGHTYFVDSIRADSQRFYSFTTRESEFHSFIIEFLKQTYTEEQQVFIRKWLKEYEIADDYKIEITSGAGSQIFLVKDNEETNLVDLGYGVTQLLPMIMKIIYCSKIGEKIIVIEEPETNLHPKFQSKLADLFLDAYKTLGIQFIVESHSEYMIRKFQYLTAKGDAKTEDIVLHYIGNPHSNKREKGEEQISTIQIKPNGQLTKPFGKGFFDEADRLVISLLDISPN